MVDQAGNVSEIVASRMFLVDTVAPVGIIGGVNVTNSGIALAGTVTDNLDLLQYDTRLVFGGLALPFVMSIEISPFGPPLATSFEAVGSTPTIRHLYGAVNAPLSAVAFGVWDAAMNFSLTPQAVVSPLTAGDGPDGFAASAFTLTNAEGTEICGTGRTAASPAGCGTGASAIPSARTLTAAVQGPSGSFNNPFTAVYFYRFDANGNPQLIGITTSGAVSDTGSGPTGRTFTFSINFNAAGLPAQDPAGIFAVGVEADGDAVVTNTVNFTIR